MFQKYVPRTMNDHSQEHLKRLQLDITQEGRDLESNYYFSLYGVIADKFIDLMNLDFSSNRGLVR